MQSVDKVIASLQKSHGEKAIRRGSELPEWKVFPTGIPGLDYQLNGGLLMGRSTIIAGVENSGKTSLACQIGGRFQKLDVPVYFIDVEKMFDAERAKVFGLDPEKAVVIRGELTAENVFDIGRDLIKSINEQKDNRACIIVDSLGSMIVENLIENSASKQFGGSARVINQAVQVWQLLLDYNQCLININQFRDTMSAMGEDKQMPGGLAQRYVGSTILWLTAGQTLKDGTDPIGHEVKWTIKKSKTSQSKERGVVNFMFETGFDNAKSLIETALEMEIIDETGKGYFTYNDERIRGRDALIALVKQNKEFMTKLETDVYSKMIKPIWNGEMIDREA